MMNPDSNSTPIRGSLNRSPEMRVRRIRPSRIRPSRVPASEEGYILLWAMFLLTAFTIWLAVAVPSTVKEIQRDREVETMERGKQYTRAIQLYYRRFHSFPPTADALVNTNQIRFLRKKYVDPMTGKDDWKPILFGQAKTQTLGFFGQPLTGAASAGGSMMAGIGPSGNGGLNGASPSGSSIGSPTASSSIFAPTDSGNNANGTAAGSGGNGSAGSSGGQPSSGSNPTGQTFGGAGIIGFSPASSRQSILIYKKKNHYNEWEFVYDPMLDMRTMSGNTGMIGQPAGSSNGSPGFNSGTPQSNPTGSAPNSTPTPGVGSPPQQ